MVERKEGKVEEKDVEVVTEAQTDRTTDRNRETEIRE